MHDFNPGIAESGLFWTTAVPDSSVDVDLEDAKASMRFATDDVRDFHDIVNALKRGPSKPASVSYHIIWSGAKGKQHTRDTTNKFVLDAIFTGAKMTWSARRSDGFTFVSDPLHTSFSLFAEIGRERNGVFFS